MNKPKKFRWELMERGVIFSGVAEDGIPFLQYFLRDYTEKFKTAVSAGCRKCLNSYYTNYINSLKMKENKCQYRLKSKYEGIGLPSKKHIRVNNGNITDALAKELLKHHPAGEKLFAFIPEEPKKVKKEKK